MPTKIEHIYVLTADRGAVAQDADGEDIDLRRLTKRLTVKGQIAPRRGLEAEALELELIQGGGMLAPVKALSYGMVLQVAGEASALVGEYIIRRVNRTYSAGAPPMVYAEGLWTLLRDTRVRREREGTDGVPRVDRVFSVVRSTAAEALALIMASAPSGFAAGTVTGLTAAQQAAPLAFDLADDTHLAAIEKIVQAVSDKTGESCEWNIRYESGTYYVDLTQQIGRAGNTYIKAGGGDASSPSNRLELTRQIHGERYFSRLSAWMGGADENIELGRNFDGRPIYWDVTDSEIVIAPGFTRLTLAGSPVPYDGWGVATGDESPHYFGANGAFYRITDSVAPNLITIRTGSAAAPAEGYFATGTGGTPLDYVKIFGVEGDFGLRQNSRQIPGSPYPNYVREAGHADTMSDWSGGLPFGGALVGTPTVAETTEPEYTKTGDKSGRITAGVGEGLEFGPYTVAGGLVSALIRVALESGEIQLQLVDEAGKVWPKDGQAVSNARALSALSVGAWSSSEDGGFTGAVSVRVLATKPNTVFILDALTVTPSNGAVDWTPVAGGRELWEEAGRIAVAEGGEVVSEYQGSGVDLAELDGFPTADAAELGAVVTLQDGYDLAAGTHEINLSTRFIGFERDYIPSVATPRWTLADHRDALVDLLRSGRPAHQEKVPPSPIKPKLLPRLLVTRTDNVDVGEGVMGAIFTFFPKTPTGDDLTNYEVFVSVGDGEFTSIGTDETRLKIPVGNALPGFLGFGGFLSVLAPLMYEQAYPEAGEAPVYLRFFVKDRATGLRSSEQRFTVRSPLTAASQITGQIIADQLIQAAQSYGKTFAFTAADTNTVTWSSGTLTFADGTAYAISAGTTGDMAAGTIHYIYFDSAVSTTALQVTTDLSDTLGGSAKMLAVARPTVIGTTAFVMDAVGALNLTGEQLAPESVIANIIAANSVSTVKLDVASLTALFAVIADLTIEDELTIAAGGSLIAGNCIIDNFGFRNIAGGAAVTINAGYVDIVSDSTSDNTTMAANGFLVTDGTKIVLLRADGLTLDGTLLAKNGSDLEWGGAPVALQSWVTALLADYYTKASVDTLLGASYYTKAEVDALIAALASVYHPLVTGAVTGQFTSPTFVETTDGIVTDIT